MCDYDAETDVLACFVSAHTLVDGIQTIGFGSRPVVRTERDVDAPVAARLLGHCLVSGGIVGIDAHEDVVIAVTDGAEIMREHLRDDLVLAPQGDEDRNTALRR